MNGTAKCWSLFVLSLALAGCSMGGRQTVTPQAEIPASRVSSQPLSQSAIVESDAGFNRSDDIIVTDQFNNRVLQIDRNHTVDWHFGDGSSVAGPNSIVGPNDAQRYGKLTLISGTGAPGGTEPTCPPPNGCVDNRVILVNREGRIVWQYGQAGVTGKGFNQLNVPVFAIRLPNHNYLITDQSNERIIEVTRDHHIVWQYGMTGIMGAGFNQLNNPNSAELLENGHVLIADENNNRVIEVDRAKHIVWQYGSPSDTKTLSGAAFASRLENGNTLITDSNNSRILEVDRDKEVVWSYITNTRPGSISMPLPTRAVRLRTGNTLISDQFNDQVIEVNHAKDIVFTQGMIGMIGTGFNQLNAPYSAYLIGDFTGLTPPGKFDDRDDDE